VQVLCKVRRFARSLGRARGCTTRAADPLQPVAGPVRRRFKVWAEANPKAAEAKKAKFIADPKNQQDCSKGNYFINEIPFRKFDFGIAK